MIIEEELIDTNIKHDGLINGKNPPYLKWRFNKNIKSPDYYQTALFATLKKLKPKYCLEIGTNTGSGSTKIFQKYFNEIEQDGILFTCDIKKYTEINDDRIVQLKVFPHLTNLSLHKVNDNDLLKDFKSKCANSIEENVNIILQELKRRNIEKLDFAYIDGDHLAMSFLKDIRISEKLTKHPHYMLLDDTKDEIHDSCHVYHDFIKEIEIYECYDFDDWPITVGCSLIHRKNYQKSGM